MRIRTFVFAPAVAAIVLAAGTGALAEIGGHNAAGRSSAPPPVEQGVVRVVDRGTNAKVRDAANQSLALMQKSLQEYPRHASCFSCHHQGVPSLALSLARSRGYAVDKTALAAIVRHTAADLRLDLASYKAGKGQPGGVTRAGYALLALQSAGARRDEVTAAVAGFLMQSDKDHGFWHCSSSRPPAEFSDFTDTLLAVRGLNTFGRVEDKLAVEARIQRAREWLESAQPKDTEDCVFRLWGLKEAGAGDTVLDKAAEDLKALQRDDGGWAQLPAAKSDAYATGSAVTILLLTGRLNPSDGACERGVGYLLDGQLADGSWHVVSRSKPFQPYFESGFPHGKDQFISMAATGWATSALVLATTPAAAPRSTAQ